MNDRNVDGYGQVNEEEEEALFLSKSMASPKGIFQALFRSWQERV